MAPTHGSCIFETDKRHGYHTYIPNPLQRINKINIDDELLSQLIDANYLLGKRQYSYSSISEPRKISDEDTILAYRDILLNESTNPTKKHVLTNMLKNIHKQLLCNNDEAGQFRKIQIFTYPKTITNTTPPCFNPPNPQEMVTALEELKKRRSDINL